MTATTTPAPTARPTPAHTTTGGTPRDVVPDLRRAAMRAMLSPSVHNTQPWRFVVGTRSLDLFADPDRRLRATDPDGRQLVISCGAALLGARLSLSAVGLPVEVTLLPDRADQDHLAHIRVLDGALHPSLTDAALDRAADDRHTNRRPFGPTEVRQAVIARLQEAAEVEGAFLRPLTGAADRAVVDALTGEAEALLFGDPGYRAELRDWAGRPGEHPDGIPANAIPAAGRVADHLPIRGFDQRGTGQLPTNAVAENDPCLLVLCADTDDRLGWLRTGQALQRVLLELTRARLVAGLFTQFTEVQRLRQKVRSSLDLIGQPQLLIRVGHAERTPATPRRPVPEVLTSSVV